VAGYIGLIAAAELCTAFVGSLSGAVVYAILLLVMLTQAVIRLAPTDDEVGATGLEVTHAILALSFLPLIRLVSLTAPVAGGSEGARYLIVGGLVLASIAWAAWGVGLPGIVLGPRAPMLQFAAVLAGVPLLVLGYLAIRPDSITSSNGRAEWVAAGAVAVAGVVDELVFRGFVQSALARLYGGLVGPALAVALYVILYADVRPAGLIAFAAAVAVVYSWFAQKTQSLLGVTVSHALVNIGLFVLLPHAAASSFPPLR
jgi:membrane protease YdiL (CAAX protease family)